MFELDEQGKTVRDNIKHEDMTVDRFFEEISRIQIFFPEKDIVSLIFGTYRGLCLQSLIEYNAVELMNLENAASRYHNLPYKGAYTDQPVIIIDAFEIIRSAIIRFENDLMKEAQKSAEKSSNVKR